MSLTFWNFGFTNFFQSFVRFLDFLALNCQNCIFPLILQINIFFFLGLLFGTCKVSFSSLTLFPFSPHPLPLPLPPPPVPTLPVSHILGMNAGRINPAGNTMSVSHDRCTKACSSDKRQLWWALSGTPQKHWRETFANPSHGSRPLGPTTGPYFEKPREKSGETRKSPSPPGTPLKRLFPRAQILWLFTWKALA